ncbi:MAG: ATP-grasp domain-containing protein [Lachnospiraceae bacterium]|nr:ATP-grasp domain-containing protein [Lachnospiraceae bacterium]MDY4068839.1 ATP-grasp domain-containing protein [Lachnospiraceae bacterium]
MNVLIASCGTRNKIIQYFKRAMAGRGRVVATDCNPNAPALYDADCHYIVPRITADNYMDVIYDICRKEKIDGILSLIDPELSLLALHEKEFEALGVKVIGSSYELCERTLNKWEMYGWLTAHGYKCARSYMDVDAFLADVQAGVISYPVFVKPAKGSASIAISKAEDEETVRLLMSHGEEMMIQEFLDGQEIGADCYIDMISGRTVSVFTKKKLVMRAGETDKGISFRDDRLFDLIEKFIDESGFRGQIDIDLFDLGGVYYISEVNPRFGGGYPHAYECGVDHMTLILNNLEGKANKSITGRYEEGLVMMKYNEIMVRRA